MICPTPNAFATWTAIRSVTLVTPRDTNASPGTSRAEQARGSQISKAGVTSAAASSGTRPAGSGTVQDAIERSAMVPNGARSAMN